MKQVNYIIRPYKNGEEHYVADAHARVYKEVVEMVISLESPQKQMEAWL